MRLFSQLLLAASVLVGVSALTSGCGNKDAPITNNVGTGTGGSGGSSGSSGGSSGGQSFGGQATNFGTPQAVSIVITEVTNVSGYSQVIGDRYFRATVTYDNGTVLRDTTQVDWRVNDPYVGTFTSPGVLHPRLEGQILVHAYVPTAYSNTLTLYIRPR